MHRRDFLKASLAATLTPTMAATTASTQRAFELDEITVAALSARMASGELSAVAIANQYLERIAAIDRAGPQLASIIELNPEAMAIAESLDRERAAGRVRSPLHGVPVLIKDNIATADKMRTSAGSLALADSIAKRDAFIVQRLRSAGCVILGKTNLSEWANFRGKQSISGWSARGGFTKNPYALNRNPSGSSSGSAVAIAANLSAVAIGTETDGSVTSPSAANGIVGFKPTLGLVSRSGIVPIAASQDTAGPMCRSVADVALVMSAIWGRDPLDRATIKAPSSTFDVAKAFTSRELKGVRLGVARNFTGYHVKLDRVFEAAITDLRALGATIIDPALVPNADKYNESELEVLLYEIKDGMPRYLQQYAPDAAVKNLADIIAFDQANAARELAFFGQEWFLLAQAKGPLTDAAYRKALARNHRYSRQEGIDKILTEKKLDALIAPTHGPAWLTDTVNGDHYGGSCTSPAAVAGYPHITVPMGFVSGLPVGLSFFSTAWSDARLIQFAHVYEQATRHRQAPSFAATASIDA